MYSIFLDCEQLVHIINNAMAEDEDDPEMETDDDDEEIFEDRSKILTNSSPKMQKLLCFLKQYVDSNPDNKLKALIFVKRRYTAKCIYHIIRRYANAHPKVDIRPDFMVGIHNNMPEAIESILANKCNEQTLERFKRNEINLIVASSVLEEGIDLQACNLVVAYDSPETFRSYVQTKGRARMITSQYVLFTAHSVQVKLMQNIDMWKQVNTILKDVRLNTSALSKNLQL